MATTDLDRNPTEEPRTDAAPPTSDRRPLVQLRIIDGDEQVGLNLYEPEGGYSIRIEYDLEEEDR
jgi:hypothetical protein